MRAKRPAELDDGDVARRLDVALEIAEEVEGVITPYFQSPDLLVETKSDDSPVTVAARDAEALLRQRIESAFPGDGILGEEHGEKIGSNAEGFRWILDPIDGTESFIRGVPLFGTLIAVEYAGISVVGVINLPALQEMVYASRDQGAWHVARHQDPIPAKVSRVSSLAGALFTSAGADGYKYVDRMRAYDQVAAACGKARGWGDCYGYYLVAIGQADLMIDPIMNLWDTAALLPIIEEAGGTYTDWSGIATTHSSNAVATNGLIHEDVLRILRSNNAPK